MDIVSRYRRVLIEREIPGTKSPIDGQLGAGYTGGSPMDWCRT